LKNFFYFIGDAILLPAILLGGIILIAILIGKCGKNTNSDDSMYLDMEKNGSESILTTTYNTTTKQHQNFLRESERKAKLSKACQFDIAYKTATQFINKNSMKIVRESNNRQEYPDVCSVHYGFYVRLNNYNSITQQTELSDKVYLVSIHLTKYNSFYSIDFADLIDEVNRKQRTLL